MHIRAFIEEMERIAPPELAEDFDAGRIGLVVEGKPDIRKVCCALDASARVAEAAAEAGAEMLVVHHTPIWRPITAVRGGTARLLRILLAAEMNLYVMHTNFDLAPGGINDALAVHLRLGNPERMSCGVVGECTLTLEEMAREIGGGLRIHDEIDRLDRIAVVGGSGFDPALIAEAASLGADAFLSAELKHSVALESPLPCIEATHHALEAPGMRMLADRMSWHYIDDAPHVVLLP
ncbi:MAG: Nif3-like dinuclear metal center hexameric protein [Methanomicrobiaceae archaeon]|uniref:Nif3-like dinuclear metal center hexameric protein n=1 Tax=hydrocarbon metagenome TaxID=938273 RepID=A0A0W8FFT4_9ZZZZ|nr:Nif3-like dinuclear metal center hexameric protein [Methanomicrobiaceae archaeon]MDD5419869.1 Nif3-like dinuclear metal center hexameric protein [Methanomicrobiaceae archaeon]